MPPAARGSGYQKCDVPPAAEKKNVAPAAPAQEPAGTKVAELAFSEKEANSVAALNGLQTCAIIIGILLVLAVMWTLNREWVAQVNDWLHQFPMPKSE